MRLNYNDLPYLELEDLIPGDQVALVSYHRYEAALVVTCAHIRDGRISVRNSSGGTTPILFDYSEIRLIDRPKLEIPKAPGAIISVHYLLTDVKRTFAYNITNNAWMCISSDPYLPLVLTCGALESLQAEGSVTIEILSTGLR